MSRSDACRVSTVVTGAEAVVVVAGEVDLQARDALVAALARAGGAGRRLVVDLSRTTFMDSSGLHAVLDAYREQRDAGADFALRAPSTPVVRLLEMAGVDRVVPVQPAAATPQP